MHITFTFPPSFLFPSSVVVVEAALATCAEVSYTIDDEWGFHRGWLCGRALLHGDLGPALSVLLRQHCGEPEAWIEVVAIVSSTIKELRSYRGDGHPSWG